MEDEGERGRVHGRVWTGVWMENGRERDWVRIGYGRGCGWKMKGSETGCGRGCGWKTEGSETG